MSEGRDLILSVSSTGLVGGTPTPIENQGDLTINPGKSINQTVYKNGQSSNQNDAGKNLSLSFGLTAPAGTGQNLLLDLNDSGDTSYFWVTNAVTGGLEYEFSGKVGIASLGSPVNGDNNVQVNIGVEGDWTRGVAI